MNQTVKSLDLGCGDLNSWDNSKGSHRQPEKGSNITWVT